MNGVPLATILHCTCTDPQKQLQTPSKPPKPWRALFVGAVLVPVQLCYQRRWLYRTSLIEQDCGCNYLDQSKEARRIAEGLAGRIFSNMYLMLLMESVETEPISANKGDNSEKYLQVRRKHFCISPRSASRSTDAALIARLIVTRPMITKDFSILSIFTKAGARICAI